MTEVGDSETAIGMLALPLSSWLDLVSFFSAEPQVPHHRYCSKDSVIVTQGHIVSYKTGIYTESGTQKVLKKFYKF